MPIHQGEPVRNRTKLQRGDREDVFKKETLLASGIVDMVDLNGNVFWLNPNGADRRRLFLHADKLDVQIRVHL